jgi:hypothetical protein
VKLEEESRQQKQKNTGAAPSAAPISYAQMSLLRQKEPYYTLELITPEKARYYLKFNLCYNRKLKKTVIKRYVADMVGSRWILTPEPIVFDRAGRLIDGQHRLMAIAISELPQSMYVFRGCDEQVAQYIDIGASRSTADILKMRLKSKEDQISTSAISIARGLWLPYGVHKSRSKPNVADDYLKYREAIDFASELHGSSPLRNGAIRAIVARAYYYEDRQRLKDFLYAIDVRLPSLDSKGNQQEDSPAIVLRNHVNDLRGRHTGNQERLEIQGRAFKALQKFLKRQRVLNISKSLENYHEIPEKWLLPGENMDG